MRSLGFLLAAIGLLAPAGCDHTVQAICEQMCTCSPCTQADLDSCVEKGDAARTAAEKKGCRAKLDTFLSCLDDNLSCQGGTGAGTDKCGKQEQSLVSCSGSGNPFLSVCEQAAQKSAMCTGGSPPPSNPTCAAQDACQSQCILATNCNAIIGITFDQDFQDCLSTCFGGGGGIK